MSIQVALNGNRSNKVIPKTMQAIVKSAISAIENGANSIHFHPRNNKGREILKGTFIGYQINALRAKLNNIPIGISTGEWIEPDLEKRLEQIKSWIVLPDFVSINYDEAGFEKVTELVSEKGIKIEVGLNGLKAAKNFTKCHSKGNFLRVLIEPQEQTLKSACETVEKIETQLNNSKINLSLLLHGVNNTCWDLFKLAIEKNYQTRIGFEDTLSLPNGKTAKTNAELIEQALQIKVGYSQL